MTQIILHSNGSISVNFKKIKSFIYRRSDGRSVFRALDNELRHLNSKVLSFKYNDKKLRRDITAAYLDHTPQIKGT